MKNKKIILICIFLVLITPIFAAETFLGIFKINEPIDLIQTCANCSFVNITSIIAPNSTKIIGNVPMTKSLFTYNYTLVAQDIKGTYQVCGVGDEDGINTVWCYAFDVTTLGINPKNKTNYLAIVVIVLFVIGILLYIADKLDFPFMFDARNEAVPVMKYLIYLLGGWLTVVAINVGINIDAIQDYGLTNSLGGFYKAIIYVMYFITGIWLIGFIFDILEKYGMIGGKDV